MQKGNYFLESLNKYITLSIESGMIARTARESVFVPKPIRDNIDVSDGYFVFTVHHLRIAFYILFVALGFSFLLLLCEVFFHFRLRYV
jgi:hypothetical protein